MISKSKKAIKLWLIPLIALVFVLFSTFYGYLYQQYMKTPSTNWSNQIMLDERTSTWDYEQIKTKDTVSLPLTESSFINAFINNNQLTIKKYSLEGALLDTTNIKLQDNITTVDGYKQGERLYFYTYSNDSAKVSTYALDINDLKLVDESSRSSEGYKVFLNGNHYSLYNDKEIIMVSEGIEESVDNNLGGTVTSIYTMIKDNQMLCLATLNLEGKQVVSNIITDKNESIDSFVFKIPANNTSIITGLIALSNEDNTTDIHLAINDVRFGVSILHNLTVDTEGNIDKHTQEQLDSFEAVPVIVNTAKGPGFILNLSVASLGRTEMSRDTIAYPNLFMTNSLEEIELNQLTKSELACIKPSYFTIGADDYLVHSEQDGDIIRTYMSSNNSNVIALSKKYSFSILVEIFFRALVHYPAILFSTMFLGIYVILPTCFIIMPIFMAKITFFEREPKKVAAFIIAIHNISKIYVFFTYIFNNPRVIINLPAYMQSGFAYFGLLLLVSTLTFLTVFLRVRQHKVINNYYKYILIYIILDVLSMNFFFGPYIVL